MVELELDEAVKAGILGEDQAIKLRNFQAKADGISNSSAEKFLLFGGLADLMAAAGLALVLIAIGIFVTQSQAFMLGLPVAGGLYLLATRINMRAAPAMTTVVMLGYFGSCFCLPASLLRIFEYIDLLDFSNGKSNIIILTIACAPFLVVSWVFWARFRYPPSLAAIATVTIFVASNILQANLSGHDWGEGGYIFSNGVMLFGGISVLIAAIWWDITDIRRETERSQVAFWFHCCAGYYIIHAVVGLITNADPVAGSAIDMLSSEHTAAIAATFVSCSIISLLLDRRSLLLGAVVPITSILSNAADATVAFAVAGTLLILFTWGWHRWREKLLSWLPSIIIAQLPRSELIQNGQRPTRRHLDLIPRGEHWRSLFRD